jgi:hypothetical protein
VSHILKFPIVRRDASMSAAFVKVVTRDYTALLPLWRFLLSEWCHPHSRHELLSALWFLCIRFFTGLFLFFLPTLPVTEYRNYASGKRLTVYVSRWQK